MNTMTQLILIAILSFFVPALIYLICSRLFQKPLLNIPIFIVLFLALAFHQIFGYDLRNGNKINIIEETVHFFRGDSTIIVVFEWLPAIIGAIIVNAIGALWRIVHTRR